MATGHVSENALYGKREIKGCEFSVYSKAKWNEIYCTWEFSCALCSQRKMFKRKLGFKFSGMGV